MTACIHPECPQPKGECPRDCLLFQTHRINTETMTKPVVAIKGKVEELPIQFAEPEPTRISAAWDAYKVHRAHSRIDGVRQAWLAFFSIN